MGIGIYSRYQWCTIHLDDAGRSFLGPRPKFTYRDLPDNISHIVQQGQRLWHVAQIYYAGMPRAGNLWWVIADFQPEPILDATLALADGSRLIVPSRRTLESQIFVSTRDEVEE